MGKATGTDAERNAKKIVKISNNVGVINLFKYFSGVTATLSCAVLCTYMTSRIVNIRIRERVWTTFTPNDCISPILKKVGTLFEM